MKRQGFVPRSASESAHETSDLDVRAILYVGGALVGILILSALGVALYFHYFVAIYPNRTSPSAPLVTASELPPTPRLQVDPRADLQAVQAAENLHLERYAWSNPQHTTAQVPIDRGIILWLKTNPNAPLTNAVPPQTELQMHQAKAQESIHAP